MAFIKVKGNAARRIVGLCKKRKNFTEKELEPEYGKKWIWTALDNATRLVTFFLLGDPHVEKGPPFS
jgi:hypothetical protein